MACPVIQITRLSSNDEAEVLTFTTYQDLAKFLDVELPLTNIVTQAAFDCKNLTNNKQCTVRFWRRKLCVCGYTMDKHRDARRHICIPDSVQGETDIAGQPSLKYVVRGINDAAGHIFVVLE